MKAVYWLPVAALAGIVVGSWGSRDELYAYKGLGRPANGQQQGAKAKASGFDAFARLMQIPDAASHVRSRREKPGKPSAAAVTNRAETADAKPADAKPQRPPRRLHKQDLEARIAEARDLWSTRVDLVRAQWKAKLKLSGESEAAFDSALQDMNDRLYDSISALAEIVSEQNRLSPETGFRLMGETATIMAAAYDRIGECVAPEMRGEVSEIRMVDFIDPGVAEPLIGVQDVMNEAADAAVSTAVKSRRDGR